MEHAYMAVVALATWALPFGVGVCGLLMCRVTLLSASPGDLRREAAIAMVRQASTSNRNGLLLVAGMRLLSECERPHGESIPLDLSVGFQKQRRCTDA